MGAFNTKKTLYASPALISTIAAQLVKEFQTEGYDVISENLSNGGEDVSISKGGVFKSVIGMKTALKITLLPQEDTILFDAGVGIFGKQIVPTLVMWYVAWPVMLTQIWGLVQQSQLDDKALAIAENVIANSSQLKIEDNTSVNNEYKYCPYCGTKNPADARFCVMDGQRLM